MTLAGLTSKAFNQTQKRPIIPGKTDPNPMSEHIQNVSDDSFETDVLGNDKPVLVDYWAEWCGPCKMIAPVLEEVADEYADKMTVAKLNIDENPNTPPKYGIRGIPTLMMFKGGEVVATKVGALSKTQLVEFIQGNL
jgi:thioredoxin 1